MYKVTKRRDFLKLLGVLASTLLIPIGVSANEDYSIIETIEDGEDLIIKAPLDKLDLSKHLSVKYEVSMTKSFDTIIDNGEYIKEKDEALTLKVNKEKLDVGTKYYYRLSAYDETKLYWFNKAGELKLV